MNASKKESIAITAIVNEVNLFDNLEEELKKRDKIPVWDGDLYLYKKDSTKKKDIVGRIPVQVKGKDGKEKNCKEKKNAYYDVEIVDIENYKKDKKGTIFFIVEVFPDRSTKIYYKIFDLETIDTILAVTQKGKKTKRIEFEELEKNQLVSICIEFMEKLKIYQTITPIQDIVVYDKKAVCYDYNTKYELEEMKEANEVFYETNAYREAKEKLENQNIIILHGEPWVGKTSTARKLVMDYIKQGYLFLYGNVDDLVEIKHKVATDRKIICLLDDFLGSNVQYLEKNVAESTLDKILTIFKNSKDKKLIMTTRTYIYNNSKQLFYKFYHATEVKDEYLIDITNYNYLEKGNILYNHLKKNNLLGTDKYIQIIEDKFYEVIINHENFNPGVINLICEKMRDKPIKDVKDYIEKALKNPETLWEEEYQKLTVYEKIILTTIVLFGVKVPIDYVEEQFMQFIKNEKIELLDKELFEKSLDRLTISFIKVTFNKYQIKQLQVTKHSIADYIITKIRKKHINLEPYIKSTKYVELLHYIDIMIEQDGVIKEQLAKKVENDFNKMKSFFYDKDSILYHILKKKLNPKRQKILKKYILQFFMDNNISFILDILENPDDVFYDFTIQQFKSFIIDKNEEEFLFELRYVSECESYFRTCLKIVNYQKNSEYMLANFYEIVEILVGIVSEDIEDTIRDTMMEYVAEDIIKGKTQKEIIENFIYGVIDDEIPSLQKLYSKKMYREIIHILYETCDIYIDEEMLRNAIMQIKQQPENRKTYHKMNNKRENLEHRKTIKEKFEEGFFYDNQTQEDEMQMLADYEEDLPIEVYKKWWLKSFIGDDDYKHYISLKHYCEFIHTEKNTDDSLKGLAKNFLKYYLYQKNNISKEAEKLLRKIAYQTLKKGTFYIPEKQIEKYEKKYSKQMKELYQIEVILLRKNGYCFLNKYLHLYIGLKECIQKNDNLILIISNWKSKEEGFNMWHKKQEILNCTKV